MPGWVEGVVAFWAAEAREVVFHRAGRWDLLRRVLWVGVLQTLGLRALAWALPDLVVADWRSAALTVATIAVLDAGLWPLLVYLTLPLTVFSFGLFTLGLNAGLLVVAAHVVAGVSLHDPTAAVLASIGLVAINTVASAVLDSGEDSSFYRNVQLRFARRQAVAATNLHPGLLIVQIDGLGLDVLELAVRSGLMPTLWRWVREGSHRLVPWECGLPSQTSASQAGILYGDDFDIPAFRWYEKETGRLIVSNHPADAAEIALRRSAGNGLLSPAGASLGTLLAGGAAHSVLTVSAVAGRLGGGPHVRSADFLGYFLDPYTVTRALVLTTWEVALELWQARRQWVRDGRPRVARGGAFPLLRAVACVRAAARSDYGSGPGNVGARHLTNLRGLRRLRRASAPRRAGAAGVPGNTRQPGPPTCQPGASGTRCPAACQHSGPLRPRPDAGRPVSAAVRGYPDGGGTGPHAPGPQHPLGTRKAGAT